MSPIRVRIVECRLLLGLTQAELAERAGVRPATISKLESGRVTMLHLPTLERVANALGVDPAMLIQHVRGKPLIRLVR